MFDESGVIVGCIVHGWFRLLKVKLESVVEVEGRGSGKLMTRLEPSFYSHVARQLFEFF